MAEEKKDLTSLMEYSKKVQESGEMPKPAEGPALVMPEIEKIDNFESLEEYSKSNKLAEPAPEEPAPPAVPVMDSFQPTPEPVVEAAPPEPPPTEAPPPPEDTQFPVSPQEGSPESAGDFPTTESPPEEGLSLESPSIPNESPADFASSAVTNAVTGQFADSPLGMDGLAANTPASAPPVPENLGGIDPTAATGGAPSADALAPAESLPPPDFSHGVPETQVAPPPSESLSVSAPPPMPPEPATSAPASPASSYVAPPPPPDRVKKAPVNKSSAMEQMKRFAQAATMARVPAAYPFSVLIDGPLRPEEREKLTDLLEREGVGISAKDLEPQFEGGKVLIPRISEYLGVMLVQALRGASVLIRLGPSDQLFATAETRADDDELGFSGGSTGHSSAEVEHPAERIPVTAENVLPGLPSFVVIDGLMASAALRTDVADAEGSSEYQELLDALRRELKYKAFRKGASAVVNFTVRMDTLTLPSHYRVLVMGSAVRPVTAPPAN
jgi:hypothetical protein